MPSPPTHRVYRPSFPAVPDLPSFRTNSWLDGVPDTADELKPLYPTTTHAAAAAAALDPGTGITLLGERADGVPEHRSYAEILDDARRMAQALAALGVQRHDRVLLVLQTSFEFVSAFLAIQMIRAVPVPAYPPAGLRLDAGLQRLGRIAARSRATVCVTSRLVRPIVGDRAFRAAGVRHVVTAEALRATAPIDLETKIQPGEPALIQFTSGSTGLPRGVLLSHASLTANIHAMGQASQINRRDVTISWLPLYHDMGLIGTLLFSIYWCIPLVLMAPTTFLRRPARWLRAISDYRGTLSPAPNFAYDLCVRRVQPSEREGLDLSSWRLPLNGSERVNVKTLREFERLYAPHGFRAGSIFPVYGLAESTLAVTFPAPGNGPTVETIDRECMNAGHAVVATNGRPSTAIVSVGKPLPGHQLRIVDESGKALPDREIGHVLVSGPSVMRAYVAEQEATADVLRDGWLWTGDLGYFADGVLYVTGRAKDLIIVNGRNIYPEDIERCAEGVNGIRPGGSVAFGFYEETLATEQVVVVCETRLGDESEQGGLADAARAAILESCGVRVGDLVLVPPRTIPKTPSGKRQRALCRAMYTSRTLRPPSAGKVKMVWVLGRAAAGLFWIRLRRLRGGWRLRS